MKARIEVDEMGRFILILPEEVVEECQLDEGDTVVLNVLDDETVELLF